jgi:hypothetical protein
MNRRMRLGLGLLLCLLGAGCSKGTSETKPQASAAASPPRALPAASPAASAPERVPLPTEPVSAAPSCRALRVTGAAEVGDAHRPLGSGSLLDGTEWVTLGANGKLTLKHSASGRELSLTGPALFRPCGRGREQVLLVRGNLLSAAGMGARPGAEVLIATPQAAVHYGDAELELRLDTKQMRLAVRAGSVEVEAVPAPKNPPKSPLQSKDALTLPVGKVDAAALVNGCKTAAEQAEALALRVTDAQSKEPLGARAQAHVRARQAARHRCMVAAAATGLVAEAEPRAGLWAEVERWEAVLERVPRRGH